MNIYTKKLSIPFFILLFSTSIIFGRSIHRPEKNYGAFITVEATHPERTQDWSSIKKLKKGSKRHNSTLKAKLESKYLKLDPLKKKFNKRRFYKFMLPKRIIDFRNKQGSVHSSTIQKMVDFTVDEIKKGKKSYKYFSLLTNKDYNYHNQSGMLVLKCKKYPFVFKIFIEHPHTMADPFSKSFETACQFVLGGNLKHLSGFTRIDNLLNAREALAKDPEYKELIDFPRKWFVMPTQENWLKVTWHNKYTGYETDIYFPSVYGIIADFIESDEVMHKKYGSVLQQKTMEVVNYLHYIIDPHHGNFVFEKNSDKIVIIDTEHFPTLVGLEREMKATNYISWYLELASNFIKKHFMQNKQTQIKTQD